MSDYLQKTTDFEDWQVIGVQARRVQHDINELGRLVFGNVPNSIHRPGFDKIDDGLTKLRSDLEDRYAREHPDEWTTDTFYGPIPPYPPIPPAEEDPPEW